MKKISTIFVFFFVVFIFHSLGAAQASEEQTAQEQSGQEAAGVPEEQTQQSGQEASPAPAEEKVQEAESQASKMVKAIDVAGNKSISLTTILSKIKTRVGQEYLQTVISDDLKRLYNTGYFSDVRVDRQDYEGGFKVIIYVEEKPIVEEITFSKTRYINSKALLSKIKTQEGQFLDNKSLKDDVQTLKDLYAQKGLTKVEVDVETSMDETTNKAKLHFIIEEGYRIRIQRINVEGNEAFPDKKILRVIKTRAKTLLNSGYVKEEVLEEDVERIKSFYEQHGFIDATAAHSTKDLKKGFIQLNISIEEGRKYSVGNITISGNKIVSVQEILDIMKETKEGGVFSREKLSVDIANIRTLYFDKGYIFADVKESTSLDPETGNVEVRLDIAEGEIAYLRKIKIQGNTHTRDIVIRRELKIYPGEAFDGSKLRRSKERLNNLGYFEEISYDIEDTDTPREKDLVVQVKEAKTGTFSFGGGFSTVDKLVGFVEIQQRNFDFTNWPTFTGGGQQLQLRFETGSTKNNLELSFTEPWIFDHPVSGGFDLYRAETTREADIGYAYDEKRLGGDIRFGKQFSDYLSGTVAYRNEEVTIGNLAEGLSADIISEEGTNRVSSLGASLTRDSTDSAIVPTRGNILSGGLDIAGGVLGGDKDFFRLQGRESRYIPLKFNSVLELRLRAGIIDTYGDSEKVPIFERFFAGGAKTIRGYEERGVGPLDSNTNDPIGGESLLVGNIEYTVPLIDFIKLAGFFDAGNVWSQVDDFASGNYKSGTGVGLRIKTPIGPVNLDYGYPLNDEPGQEGRSGKFYFSVSRGF